MADEHSSQNDTQGTDNHGVKEAMTAIVSVSNELQRKAKRDRRWATAKSAFWIGLFAVVIIGYATFVLRTTSHHTIGKQAVPSVAVIPLVGDIGPNTRAGADQINPFIKQACSDPEVKAIILNINSPGGSPVQANRIIAQMNNCRANHKKPIYALVGGMAASAAYMIAMHTDRIYASKYSAIGSIGALITYFDFHKLANRLGVKQQIIRSMPLKGGPSRWTKTTPAETAVNKQMVTSLGHEFLADVLKCRGKKLTVGPKVLFSGRMWTAKKALKMGLIDKIAVLENLEEGPFKKLHFVTYDTRTPMEKLFNTKVFLQDVMAELTQVHIR